MMRDRGDGGRERMGMREKKEEEGDWGGGKSEVRKMVDGEE